eukprot:COSAG06_NODE_191_length_20709_cov_8.536778_3_plen_81_part_00
MISRWIGFEVNVPGQLKQLHPEANITAQGGAWALDALDPLFTKLSDACVRAAMCYVCTSGLDVSPQLAREIKNQGSDFVV